MAQKRSLSEVGAETAQAANVCFGTLFPVHGLFLKLGGRQSKKIKATHQPSNQPQGDGSHIHFNLQEEEDSLFLADSSLGNFAVIDTETTEKLQALSSMTTLLLEAIVESSVFSKRPKGSVKQQGSTFRLSVNIYGPSTLSTQVSRELSLVSAYLQHPYSLPEGIRYDNPHFFKAPDVEIDMNRFVGEHATPEFQKDKLATEMIRFLEYLESGDAGCSGISTEGLNTKLHSHQEVAVRFMLQRETNEYVTELHRGMGIPPNPSDKTFGGIIADTMGLGKTLSSLGAVLGSLPKARAFVEGTGQPSRAGHTQRTRATLIVVTSAQLLDGWLTELSLHVKEGALNVEVFHGQGRTTETDTLVDRDIVLTTYATLASNQKAKGILHQLIWYRVVLDEAHWIRNSSSSQFRAAAALRSHSRWCLTGTPIQNNLDDLLSLSMFLRLPPLESKQSITARVTSPLSAGTEGVSGTLRTYLQAFCLRRSQSCLKLPPSQVEPIEIPLTESEKAVYDEIISDARRTLDAKVSRKSVNSYNIRFMAIFKLRRLCSIGIAALKPSNLSPNPGMEEVRCDFCAATDEDTRLLLAESTMCPFCGRYLPRIGSPSVSESGPGTPVSDWSLLPSGDTPEETGSCLGDNGMRGMIATACSSSGELPTKLSQVLKTILEDSPDAKHIAFSSWTTTFDLLSPHLTSAGVGFVVVDGRVSYSDRRARLQMFRSDPSISVLLMTIGTGAVGLNLTAANRVHIIEPQWNPSVEDQAIGRAVRMGQTRPVTIYRYLTRDTVEQGIASLQEKKRDLAMSTLDRSSSEGLSGKLAELKFVLDI